MMLSAVITARNDNYGGDFQDRLRRCLQSLVRHFCRTGISAEIVVVEWNPTPSEPSLRALLQDTLPAHALPIRIISVPPEVHANLPGSSRSPMFEYRAKNVGIRRAAGDYILAMNPDIILSTGLHNFLNSRRLRETAFYRVDRYNLPAFPDPEPDADGLGRWCRTNWTSVLTYWSEINRDDWFRRLLNEGAHVTLPMRGGGRGHPHGHGAGDFMLMHRKHWWSLEGYRETAVVNHLDSVGVFAALSLGLDQEILRGDRRIFHQHHERSEQRERISDLDNNLLTEARRLLREGQAFPGNGPDWGLGSIALPESTT